VDNRQIRIAFRTIVFFTLVSVPMELAVEFAIAYLLCEPFRGRGLPGLALLATIATEIWRKTPLVSFLLLPGVLAVPSDQWEQASLEGIPTISQARHIALPSLRSLILTVALLLIGDSLGTFDGVPILSGVPGLSIKGWYVQRYNDKGLEAWLDCTAALA
jgi:ABC-type sugar transport system permease subunit